MSRCVRLPSCPNLHEIQSRIWSGLYPPSGECCEPLQQAAQMTPFLGGGGSSIACSSSCCAICSRVSSRIDTVSVKNESYSIDERPALSCTTQACSRETGKRVRWARDVGLLKKRGGLMPIRIRIRDTWLPSRNSLKRQQLWRIVRERQWRVIRTENGRSGSYADLSKHCWASS